MPTHSEIQAPSTWMAPTPSTTSTSATRARPRASGATLLGSMPATIGEPPRPGHPFPGVRAGTAGTQPRVFGGHRLADRLPSADGRLRPDRGPGTLAGPLGAGPAGRAGPRSGGPGVEALQPGRVPLPVGRGAARRPHLQLRRGRHVGALPADAG